MLILISNDEDRHGQGLMRAGGQGHLHGMMLIQEVADSYEGDSKGKEDEGNGKDDRR
jgi:hypothetical protein